MTDKPAKAKTLSIAHLKKMGIVPVTFWIPAHRKQELHDIAEEWRTAHLDDFNNGRLNRDTDNGS